MSEVLPKGIDIEFDAKYRAMFSYKAKNYALLDEDDRMILKGGALKSRGMERFQRQYLEPDDPPVVGRPAGEGGACCGMSSSGRFAGASGTSACWRRAIRLQDSLGEYRKKIEGSARNRSAPYELGGQERPQLPARRSDSVLYNRHEKEGEFV